MNQFNPSFTGSNPIIRTSAREYANPVDYSHPYESMARFAALLALRYDANRTRHAYYRQLRLIQERLQCDPATITETQLRDYFLFVKLKKRWQPKSIRQAAAAARLFFIDLLAHPRWTLFSQIRTKDHDRLPGRAHAAAGDRSHRPHSPAPLSHADQTHLRLRPASE
jgi:hypothetical protein